MAKSVAIKPEAAWGGIGGSGKHAGEAIAELASDPKVAEMLSRLPKTAWGGIGGSGKHAAELLPELSQVKEKK
ncbi:MAG TPA: hypothetical protein VHE61_20965 [Opitutaceae bacterium]|nr:hypothetical protein [Opitutaceae bacterium]